MKDQLLNTWQIHQRMNIVLLQNITEDGLSKSGNIRGGRSIRQQFIHIHNVRLQWLEICAKEIFKKYTALDKDKNYTAKELIQSLDSSATGIRELLESGWENQGKIKGFKTGVIPMLGYFISHESHHRGNIIMTLKLSGEKIPDAVKWEIWEWNN